MSARRLKRTNKDSSRKDSSLRELSRRTKARLERGIRHGGSNLIEALEQRTLFNTVITDTDPLTSTPATVTFEYKDGRDNPVRVVVHGDVSAEFIFARVTEGDEETGEIGNQVILGEYVAASNEDEDGRDLFHVYIAQASIDSYISIAEFDDADNGPNPMTPFDGSVTLRIQQLRTNDDEIATAGGTGNIYLGARTRDSAFPEIDDDDDIPVRSDNFNGQGIAPISIANRNGRLVAGVSTAAGVSIGKFMFAGTVSGQVTFQGSIDTFYCGALLTGVTEGQFNESSPEAPSNFFVAGDARNILVKGSIGGDGVASTRAGRVEQHYTSGVDIDVRGRVGQIRTGEDYQAWAKVSNTNAGLGLRTRQQEVEFRIDPDLNRGNFTEFENGQFGDNEAFFNNDTFETAQFLGSINSKQLGNNSIQLNGLLQALTDIEDISDYYAVPLMAGQQISVRLLAPNVFSTIVNVNGQLVVVTEETKLPLNVGVFDPDGRLIATDYSTKTDRTSQTIEGSDPTQQEQFTFIAEKPGIYRIAVAQYGDAPAFGESGDLLGELPYQLQLTGVGNMGLGGLVARESITTGPSVAITGATEGIRANIEVVKGDLGAVYSIEDGIDSFGGAGITAIAQGGDFRAIDAETLGGFEGTIDEEVGGFTKSGGVNIIALTGSVGMIRTREQSNAIMTLNAGGPFAGLPNIGGDIQYIVCNSILDTDIAANGSIGVVQTQFFGDAFGAGSLSANADGLGSPETIDLIDVSGSLGTLGQGGPVISAGPGGNVRYIHLAEGAGAFRPTIFGGGNPDDTTFVAGQSFTYTDDSGANVTITPTIERSFDPITLLPIELSGTLTVLSYPIAQSVTNPFGSGGGLSIIRVTSTRGLRIDTDGATEIGDIVSTGSGPGLVVDPVRPGGEDGTLGNGDEKYVLNPNATGNARDNSITLKGSGRRGLIDVWNVRGNSFNFIRNDTGGEMVNAQIGATETVRATNIGWSRSTVRPGMLVEGIAVAGAEADVFPFLQAKNAFTIDAVAETSAAIINLTATQAIGNVIINGIAENIVANSDNIGVKGTVEGIIGAVYLHGQVRLVDVGEGLLPSGTGNFGRAGIYATCSAPGADVGCGRIWDVVANNADIRGDIISNTAINRVTVNNGSIINADIMVMQSDDDLTGTGADLTPSLEWGGATVIQSGQNRTGEIQSITVNGGGTTGGGIIGCRIVAFNIGPVTVQGGFGIFNTSWGTVGTGRIDAITADGYGIRGASIQGGQSVASITANGNGQRLQTTKFSSGVRLSETQAIDPFFGTKPNSLTDLHVVLGTTKSEPSRKGVSASGSIDFTQIGVSRDVSSIRANTIRASNFNIPNQIGSFETTDYIDTVNIVTGRSPVIAIGKDALRSSIQAAGDVQLISIGGAFRGTSSATVQGKLGKFVTGTSLYGNVYAQRGIDSIRVGTHYGSQGGRTAGNLGEFVTNGHLLTGSKFTVGKNVNRLVIGGDVQDGATFDINGTLGTKTIIGEEVGDILVG